MKHFFITSTGTGIGKTLVTCALVHQLRQSGKKVTALKPVISGYDPADDQSDTALILKASGLPPAQVDSISPWWFASPLAPSMAAAKEAKSIDIKALTAFCKKTSADVVLVEGAGGVMAPLTEKQTMLDWMAALSWPVILVTGSYLGAISHTLTAAETLRARGIKLHAAITSESQDAVAGTTTEIKKFLPEGIPVITIPRLAPRVDIWTHVPPISGLL